LPDRLAPNEVRDQAGLGRRHPDVVRDGLGQHGYFSAVDRSVCEPWARKVRVGENSPSLCPTMFSVMYTGMNFRPLCTASVWPTNSGEIVERRDQVLTTFFCRELFSSSTLSRRCWSMNGPFLSERPMSYFLRRSTIYRSDGLRRRVLAPLVGRPHGVMGWLPLPRPSPPPIGWSTGFIATPRTVGRMPFQRDRPALPTVTFSWSMFPTCPIVARQSIRISR